MPGKKDKTVEHLRDDLEVEQLDALFVYDPFTGSLKWRTTKGSRAQAGSEVGYNHGPGYRRVEIDGVGYMVHRIIWCMVYREWPTFFVDHENLDKADNRLDNLRPATRSQNAYNRPRACNNTSGVKGVSWHKQKQQWYARVAHAGKTVFAKAFDFLEDAERAVIAIRYKLHKEYARNG